MIDIYLLRKDLNYVIQQLARRNFSFDETYFLNLEQQRKTLQIEVENLQAQRNSLSKQIGQAKQKKLECSDLMQEVEQTTQNLHSKNSTLEIIQAELDKFLLNIPNIIDDSVPNGTDEQNNKEISTYKTPAKFNFTVKDHVDLGQEFGLDFATATKLSGSRFVVLKNKIAKLHRALAQFMLDLHTKNGYQEVYVPYLVNAQSMQGTGQLPKFAADLFKIENNNEENKQDFYLIPTAEVPITNMFRQQLLKEDELPLKFVAHTPCFRSEAGSAGRDTRGLIRQHQFDKVELVQIVSPKNSAQSLEELTLDAENILKMLDLPYRKMLLCSGDMGFGSSKTYDLEVWLPAQNTYREISSCSNMTDFQARRMQTRFKNKDNEINLVHTLNGSALAVGRTLVAILENYQNADGSINVPEVLHNYCGFQVIN